jgi:hypothetical protein
MKTLDDDSRLESYKQYYAMVDRLPEVIAQARRRGERFVTVVEYRSAYPGEFDERRYLNTNIVPLLVCNYSRRHQLDLLEGILDFFPVGAEPYQIYRLQIRIDATRGTE